ncbi:hypothetical protein [uncultured Parabacteroides sp.]|uniref:hypothetical protein n=1 Tax=uncultured Parabacteroides sp. TaxID=512312 RepID=UPI00258DF0FA|nr:hypothetical protein [uncultured Parabacteroides sp.]
MKKQMFVCCLLLMLAFASCTKMEVGFKDQVYLYMSEPEINRYSLEKWDSIVVKGFSDWAIRDEYKGMLPDSVVRDSGYDKSYVYYICTVTAKVKMEELDFAFSSVSQGTKLGYTSSDMEERGTSSAGLSGGTDRFFIMRTCLIYISQEKDGKKMDVWYPYSPDDLEWHCLSLKDSK